MAEESNSAPGGLFESLKSLSGNLIGIAHNRLELLSTDVAEEREHLVEFLILVLVALFCLGIGVVLLTILVIVVFWESHRLAALIGLSGFFLAAGVGVGWFAMHRIRTKPRLFEASLTELSKDWQQLTPGP